MVLHELRREISPAHYGPETAGGLMGREFLSYPETAHVDEVVADLRRNAEHYAALDVQYLYIVEPEQSRLRGTLPLRDLILAPGSASVAQVMLRHPKHVRVDANLDELEEFFDKFGYQAAPVIDEYGRLLGVVRRARLQAALQDRADKTLLRLGGIVGGEELRAMPTGQRAARRLAFLLPNIGLNLLAASVIALNEHVIREITALAVFMPILSDMSGCSGNQAVAVTLRELSLGVITPRDAARTLRKEVGMGLLNGVVLGVVLGVIATLLRGREWGMIGVVVGLAMMLNCVLSVAVGSVVPLTLKRMRFDPALASGPILTTVTDMCGFFFVIFFAKQLLL